MARSKRPGLNGLYRANVNDGTFARLVAPRTGLIGARPTPAALRAEPTPAPIYEEDVHDNLTEVLALAAGFGVGEAREIAAADQETDTNLATSPMPYWTRTSWGIPYYSVGADRRRLWHFTTAARRAEVKRQYQQSGSMRDLGRYMHVLQDRYSHEGLNPVVGQIGTSVDPQTGETRYDSPNPLDQAPWHEADDPSRNPLKAMTMARESYDELVEAKEYLAEHGRLRTSFEAIEYSEIRKDVERFCREPDKNVRKAIADRIGAFVLQQQAQRQNAAASEMQQQIEEMERRGRVRTIKPQRKRGRRP